MALVPQERRKATGAQHTQRLRARARRIEPVKGLSREPQIDALPGQRGGLGGRSDAAKARLGTETRLGRRAHGIVRLDADDPRAALEELLTQNPRSRADIRHHGARGEPALSREQVDGRPRITRAVAPVVVRSSGEPFRRTCHVAGPRSAGGPRCA